jgi:hypothetical protein
MSEEGVVFLRWKHTLNMPYDPQSGPDIVFLRNTGIALLALTLAVGAISVVGSLKTRELVEPVVLAQSVDGGSPAADLK